MSPRRRLSVLPTRPVVSRRVSSDFIPVVRSMIVITGVTRGLGRAMVDEFIRLGHTVLGCARTQHQIARLALKYPQHDFQTVDVASDSQVKTWASSLLAKYGAPDFVLNNAAIVNVKAPLWRVKQRDFSNEVDINVKGVANVIRHFAPSMIRRGHGVFVNFTSRWGQSYEPNMGPYCATKWAVVALTRVLAAELKHDGLTAIGLNPGIVKTGMLKRYLRNSQKFAATNCISAADWAKIAVPFILRLRPSDSGKVHHILVQPRRSQDTLISKHK